MGNAGGDHAQDGNAYALALYHYVWGEVCLACTLVDDVCSQNRVVAFPYPAVVYVVACLDVVIAYSAAVIVHLVHCGCNDVRGIGIDEIVVVCYGLTLQHITAVREYDAAGMCLAQIVHIAVYGRQTAQCSAVFQVVVREYGTVHIAGVSPIQDHITRM